MDRKQEKQFWEPLTISMILPCQPMLCWVAVGPNIFK